MPAPRSRRLMVRAGAFAGLIALIAAACGSLVSAQDQVPVAVTPETVFNAGAVPEGAVIHHDFVLWNKGASNLLLTGVTSQCRCTTVQADELIPPGGRGRISLDVNTTGFSGSISKAVIATTNDPANPSLKFTVMTDVKTYYQTHPYRRFTFPNVKRSSGAAESLTLWSEARKTFAILSVESSVPGLKVTYEAQPQIEAVGTRYKITAGLTPEVALGTLKGEVTLKTDLVELPVFKIPVSGFVLGPIQAEPPSLNFIGVDPAQPASLTRAVTLTAEPGKSLKVGKVVSSSPLIKASVLPDCSASACRLEVAYLGGGQDIWKAAVTVDTGLPEQPSIEIPVVGKAIAIEPAGGAKPKGRP